MKRSESFVGRVYEYRWMGGSEYNDLYLVVGYCVESYQLYSLLTGKLDPSYTPLNDVKPDGTIDRFPNDLWLRIV